MAQRKGKTVKDLGSDVEILNKEIDKMKIDFKTICDEFSLKMKILEGKINDKSKQCEEKEENRIFCKQCQQMFESIGQLKKHMKRSHAKKFKCDKCDQEMSSLSAFEFHLLSCYTEISKFKCEKCDNEFITEIRLKNHQRMHETQVKYCHFFNNGKVCKFAKLGCRFKHEESEKCKYGDKCKKQLCGYKHFDSDESEEQKSSEESNEMNHSRDDQNSLPVQNEEPVDWRELEEAKDMICDQYCDLENGFHIHLDDMYEQFFGLDTENVEDENSPMSYPCKFCENTSSVLDIHEKHVIESHPNEDRSLNCMFVNCEYKNVLPETLANHITVKHNHFIKKRLGRI